MECGKTGIKNARDYSLYWGHSSSISGYHAPGASMGFEYFDKKDYLSYAKDCARIAVTMINAEYSPSGQMPDIIQMIISEVYLRTIFLS